MLRRHHGGRHQGKTQDLPQCCFGISTLRLTTRRARIAAIAALKLALIIVWQLAAHGRILLGWSTGSCTTSTLPIELVLKGVVVLSRHIDGLFPNPRWLRKRIKEEFGTVN